jgi:GrpB-like predicted nucleotidyltransferase (UPF0157 family)
MNELHHMTPEELGRLFPIEIVDYCPGWPISYLAEKRMILQALAEIPEIKIDHIGSTAVTGMASKPIIDILVQLPENTPNAKIIFPLQNMGYDCIHKPETPPPHLMFVKGYTPQGYNGQAFHIHVRYPGMWDELFFKKILSRHPEVAEEYVKLKKQLARQFRNDREGYTEAKSAFVRSVCTNHQDLS